jgi:hypothetical protein
MAFLVELWMPIVVASVFVFLLSSIFHMALPIHKNDYTKLADEESVLEVLRRVGVKRGLYMFPMPDSMKDCSSPEMVAKFEKGPAGWITVLPKGKFNIGKCLALWFLQILITSVFVGYVGWHAMAVDQSYPHVFQVTGAAGLLGYSIGCMSESIWRGAPWVITFKFIAEGIAYALATAGTFGWLWPV